MAMKPTEYNKLAVTNPSTNLSEILLLLNFISLLLFYKKIKAGSLAIIA